MRHTLLFAALLVIPVAGHAQLQITAGATMTIAAGTAVVSDSLVIKPASQLALINFSVTPSYTAATDAAAAPSINRVYQLSQPITTDGEVGFFYADAELNSNTAANLQLAYYDGSTWTTATTGSNATTRYAGTTFASATTLTKVTAVSNNIALPIQLTAFEANAEGTRARIDWTVARPEDILHYEAERSTDGAVFTAIGLVAGSTMSGYILYDNSPATGINYYRIRITNKAGNETVSIVKPVLFSRTGAQQLLVYPVPVQKVLNIRTALQPNAGATLTLTDVAGKVILTQPCTSTTTQLNVQQLAGATYFLQFIDGATQLQYKVQKL